MGQRSSGISGTCVKLNNSFVVGLAFSLISKQKYLVVRPNPQPARPGKNMWPRVEGIPLLTAALGSLSWLWHYNFFLPTCQNNHPNCTTVLSGNTLELSKSEIWVYLLWHFLYSSLDCIGNFYFSSGSCR